MVASVLSLLVHFVSTCDRPIPISVVPTFSLIFRSRHKFIYQICIYDLQYKVGLSVVRCDGYESSNGMEEHENEIA